jgi:hypothetical protein
MPPSPPMSSGGTNGADAFCVDETGLSASGIAWAPAFLPAVLDTEPVTSLLPSPARDEQPAKLAEAAARPATRATLSTRPVTRLLISPTRTQHFRWT